MLFDREPFHHGYNVAFPDGHVEFKGTKEFHWLMPAVP
jgi:prepilin-type processing-associated H-X9-DG protein